QLVQRDQEYRRRGQEARREDPAEQRLDKHIYRGSHRRRGSNDHAGNAETEDGRGDVPHSRSGTSVAAASPSFHRADFRWHHSPRLEIPVLETSVGLSYAFRMDVSARLRDERDLRSRRQVDVLFLVFLFPFNAVRFVRGGLWNGHPWFVAGA